MAVGDLRWLSVILLIALVLGLLVTRLVPRVAVVEVAGQQHLTPAEVMALAKISPGDPFLWIHRGHVDGLAQSPWVLRARVTRSWPDRVHIGVVERTPVLSDGMGTGWSADGTLLPGLGAAQLDRLPQLAGWGTPRIEEALELLAMLSDRGVQVITYGPEGFEVVLAEVVLFTPSLDALRAQWSAFESQRGSRVAVYPWGVSSAP
jgi:cell division protein FtsQ